MSAVNSNGARFYNPGSLGRPEISSDYEKNKVGVMLFSFDFSNNRFGEKFIELKDSLAYDIVFDLDRNKKNKIENKNTEMFIETVTNVSMDDTISSDINADLKTFAEKRNVSNDVINVAINTINLIKTGGEL
jgi:hypothetical protein